MSLYERVVLDEAKGSAIDHFRLLKEMRWQFPNDFSVVLRFQSTEDYDGAYAEAKKIGLLDKKAGFTGVEWPTKSGDDRVGFRYTERKWAIKAIGKWTEIANKHNGQRLGIYALGLSGKRVSD